LCLHGEQGSAKSTTARVIKALCDPNSSPLRSAPREPRDLFIGANNSWLLALDNLSRIPDWLADCLCRLATGGGLATRELYSDSEEILFDAMRPCMLTSIEELAGRGDLLDRCIILNLPAISEPARRAEAALWGEFKWACPRILGALLDAVSGALANIDDVDLPFLPRLADFALWATAAEPALGWAHGSFLNAYTANRSAANELALDSAVVVAPLRQLLAGGNYEGTAGQLLERLTTLAGERLAKSPAWAKSPRSLAGQLRRIAPNLRHVGIDLRFDRETSSKRQRLIYLTQSEIGNDRPDRPDRPNTQKRPENQRKAPDGTSGPSDGISSDRPGNRPRNQTTEI
jgi:hypothetical protein